MQDTHTHQCEPPSRQQGAHLRHRSPASGPKIGTAPEAQPTFSCTLPSRCLKQKPSTALSADGGEEMPLQSVACHLGEAYKDTRHTPPFFSALLPKLHLVKATWATHALLPHLSAATFHRAHAAYSLPTLCLQNASLNKVDDTLQRRGVSHRAATITP